MKTRRIVITGTESGAGKTTITIGIMAALKQKGYTVQGFKCGPDYIDPTYHTAVTGRPSRNLDSWMLSEKLLKEIFHFGSDGADIAIIEGVMGFYDGKNPKSNQGSTAEISIITESPTILVINCEGMARSAAAIVKGFQTFADHVNIVGVIANKVGSEGHYRIVKEAIEQECNIPVIGYLTKNQNIEIPERHLGLIPSIERGELDSLFETLGRVVTETINLNELLSLSETRPLIHEEKRSLFQQTKRKKVNIAVAKDAAFHFYYQENLELLEAYGAKLKYFSPLKGETLPEHTDGLYIGGGFPEEFAETLSIQADVKRSIQQAIIKGMPVLAECGGFMYLTESIEVMDGRLFPMVGAIKGKVKMHKKLMAIGYREVSGTQANFLLDLDESARGHEFHYSSYISDEKGEPAYESKGRMGVQKEGIVIGNVIAGYTHLHFASCPQMVQKWLNKCMEWKNNGESIDVNDPRDTI